MLAGGMQDRRLLSISTDLPNRHRIGCSGATARRDGVVDNRRRPSAVSRQPSAVDRQPEDHQSRRLLFDLRVGTEDRSRAIPHSHELIRQRKFDIEMLLATANTSTRSMQSAPLVEVGRRNENDQRPLVGSARVKFDENKLDECIGQLLAQSSCPDSAVARYGTGPPSRS